MNPPSQEWLRYADALTGDLDCTIGRPKPPRDASPTLASKLVDVPVEMWAKPAAGIVAFPRKLRFFFSSGISSAGAELESWLRKATEKIAPLVGDSATSEWIVEVLDNGADVAVYRRAA